MVSGTNSADDPRQGKGRGFFNRNVEPKAEVVEGLIREGQIVALGGPYRVGKSPLLHDLTICLLRGISWCGRKVIRRPIIAFDFESSSPMYKGNLLRIALRYQVPEPSVPNELAPYLQNDDPNEPLTARLLQALKSKNLGARLGLVDDALQSKPDAVVIVDPTELLFRIDTREKAHVTELFSNYRCLLAKYPKVVLINTFNMRKRDRKTRRRPDLLSDPRGWLEEICGTLDLMNRSDVRLGMDFYGSEDDGIKVINGLRRGEDLDPILIRPYGDQPHDLAGFERIPPDQVSLTKRLTVKQREYWDKLPKEFSFQEAVDIMGKANFSRLRGRALSQGILEDGFSGVYRKLLG